MCKPDSGSEVRQKSILHVSGVQLAQDLDSQARTDADHELLYDTFWTHWRETGSVNR
ncbi:MAG: hypothetical protein K0Q83_4175 [Deltaproteobacteria bacterium]|nr:hypothetical protein [Deltaproteobacteria bacterium]